MRKNKQILSVKEIIERQKELCKLGVFEEIKEYRITNDYFNSFLNKYSEFSGRYGYIQGAILFPLFKKIEEAYPDISDEEKVHKAQKLFPIVRAMLNHEKVFNIIKGVVKKSDKEVKKELKEMNR